MIHRRNGGLAEEVVVAVERGGRIGDVWEAEAKDVVMGWLWAVRLGEVQGDSGSLPWWIGGGVCPEARSSFPLVFLGSARECALLPPVDEPGGTDSQGNEVYGAGLGFLAQCGGQ